MTFLTSLLTLSIAATAPASPQPAIDCSLPGPPPEHRVFTNADLERMAACRYQTGAQSEVGNRPSGRVAGPARRAGRPSPSDLTQEGALEAEWRARWLSVDQKVRRLRREAIELRQEAGQAPRDPKKQPTGRRSPALLIARARSLEAQAKEIEDEFQERARREGARPGWLRPRGR
jgi:hypothetical protein